MSDQSFKFRCTADLRLRVKPNTNSEIIMVMAKDSIQTAVGVENDWYKVMTMYQGKPYAGYCYSGYCVKVEDVPQTEIKKPSTSSTIHISSTHDPHIEKSDHELTKDEITDIVWDFFISEGLSEKVAAAVMGNIEIESGGFNVKALGARGLYYGLCQWTGGRYDNLKTKARQMGKLPSSLDVQLAHLMDEFNGTEVTFASRISMRYGSIQAFKTSNGDIAKLTRDFMETFERPSSNPDLNHIDKRIDAANMYYNKYAKSAK